MSSLLERMVQRTLAPLSGVEPLLQPLYASQRPVSKRPSDTQANDPLPETSPFPPVEFERNAPEPSTDHSPSATDLPTSQVVLKRSSQSDPAIGPLPETSVARRRPSFTVPKPEPLPGAGPLGEIQDVQQRPGIPNPASSNRRKPRLINEGDSAGWTVPASVSPPFRSVSSSGSLVGSIRSQGQANERMAPEEQTKAESKASVRSGQKNSPFPGQELSSGIPDTAENSSRDVTISIGQIEIRAAPAAEPPRKPGFRPRVSLSDFLNRPKGDGT